MGRKRRCVGTQLDATAVKNHVRMRGTQGTQEMVSVTSGRGASASDVEYIFADVLTPNSYSLVAMNSFWHRACRLVTNCFYLTPTSILTQEAFLPPIEA